MITMYFVQKFVHYSDNISNDLKKWKTRGLFCCDFSHVWKSFSDFHIGTNIKHGEDVYLEQMDYNITKCVKRRNKLPLALAIFSVFRKPRLMAPVSFWTNKTILLGKLDKSTTWFMKQHKFHTCCGQNHGRKHEIGFATIRYYTYVGWAASKLCWNLLLATPTKQ